MQNFYDADIGAVLLTAPGADDKVNPISCDEGREYTQQGTAESRGGGNRRV